MDRDGMAWHGVEQFCIYKWISIDECMVEERGGEPRPVLDSVRKLDEVSQSPFLLHVSWRIMSPLW